MKERRDLGVTLVAATALMLSLVYLTQCSSRVPTAERYVPTNATAPGVARDAHPEHRPESAPAAADNADDEEAAKVKSIGRALQTIGADPELRKTYGFER